MSVLPTAVVIARQERRQDKASVGVLGRRRTPVKIAPELSPPPQQDGAFYGVGRDPMHTWPVAPSDPNMHLGILDIQSHMAPWFLFPKVPSALVVGMPRGAQLPVAPRPNIESPGQSTYGALSVLQPDPAWSPVYRKLMGG